MSTADFTMRALFSFLNQKRYSSKVSYHRNSDIWEETVVLIWWNNALLIVSKVSLDKLPLKSYLRYYSLSNTVSVLILWDLLLAKFSPSPQYFLGRKSFEYHSWQFFFWYTCKKIKTFSQLSYVAYLIFVFCRP